MTSTFELDLDRVTMSAACQIPKSRLI